MDWVFHLKSTDVSNAFCVYDREGNIMDSLPLINAVPHPCRDLISMEFESHSAADTFLQKHDIEVFHLNEEDEDYVTDAPVLFHGHSVQEKIENDLDISKLVSALCFLGVLCF